MTFLQSQTGLALLGYLMVGVFTALVLSRRVSPLVALIATPVVFAVIGGFGAQLGPLAVEGLRTLAPTIVMITFAVLYFSLMLDAGLFTPLVDGVVRLTRDDPVRITVGTACLGLFIAFSGDGISTGLVMLAAFMPVYRRMRMNTTILGALMAFAVAVQNLSPWGGPTPRAAAALNLDPTAIFMAVLPSVAAGMIAVVVIAYILGRAERRRLAAEGADVDAATGEAPFAGGGLEADPAARRPRLIWVNLALTVALMAALVTGLASPVVLFPIASAAALMINYPSLKSQRERVAAHADNLTSFILLFFGAGIFTGVLNGTGMIEAMAGAAVSTLPAEIGRLLAPITAVASMPLTYFMPNDAFFFGALPVLAKTAEAYGITPLQMAVASLLGQPVHVLSPLLPSLYVFSALLGVEPGKYLKLAVPWGVVVCLAMIAAALLFGAIPLVAS